MRTHLFRGMYASCCSLRRQTHQVVLRKACVRLDARAVETHLSATQPLMHEGIRRERKRASQVAIKPLSRLVGGDATRTQQRPRRRKRRRGRGRMTVRHETTGRRSRRACTALAARASAFVRSDARCLANLEDEECVQKSTPPAQPPCFCPCVPCASLRARVQPRAVLVRRDADRR